MPRRIRRRIHTMSVDSRRRAAAATILLGKDRPRVWDRPVSWLYYTLAAREWSEKAVDDDHLVAFVDGLEHCREAKRAVDLGTGAGASAAALARHFPLADVVGLDNSAAMLRHANRLHHEANLSFVRGTASSLSYETGSVDLVTTLNAAPDVNEVARVLTDGGQFLMVWSVSETGTAGSDDIWLARCRQAGLDLVEEGRAARGRWQLFDRRARA